MNNRSEIFLFATVLEDLILEFIEHFLLLSSLFPFIRSRSQTNDAELLIFGLQVEVVQVSEHSFIRLVNDHDLLLGTPLH